jgi:hypothetical protein
MLCIAASGPSSPPLEIKRETETEKKTRADGELEKSEGDKKDRE